MVAVIDSGFDMDHTDLASNLLAGYDTYEEDSNPDPGGTAFSHGTFVSGIIAGLKNGVNTHGVAYDAKILPIRAGDNSGYFYHDVAEAINYARTSPSNVDVINLSLGSLASVPGSVPGVGQVYFAAPVPNPNSLNSQYGTALGNATNDEIVVVLSAGNEGFNSQNGRIVAYQDALLNTPLVSVENSQFFQYAYNSTGYKSNMITADGRLPLADSNIDADHWLTVVATDASGTIASFSNGCGDAKNFCLAAPGVDVSSLNNNNGTAVGNGTSFSAAYVSGSIAILLDAFPSLTSAQVVDLLLSTTQDLGIAGVDSVYGHGLIDLDAATQPQGSSTVLAYDSSTPLSLPTGNLSSSFGDSLSEGKVAFLDDYGRIYAVDVASTRTLRPQADLLQRFDSFTQITSAFAENTQGSILSWSGDEVELNKQQPGARLISLGYLESGNLSPMFAYHSTDALRAGLGLNPAIYQDQNLKRMQLSLSTGTTSSMRMGFSFSDTNTDDDLSPETDANQDYAYDMEFATRLGNTTDFALSAGALFEQNSMLGSTFDGAFAIEKTNTYFTGISLTQKISDYWILVGNYLYAQSDVSTESSGFQVQDLSADSYLLGLTSYDVLFNQDYIMFSYRQPLRVSSGTAQLSHINGYGENGDYVNGDAMYGLSPSGNEQIFEIAYLLPLAEGNQHFSLTTGYSNDSGNIADERAFHLLLQYRMQW